MHTSPQIWDEKDLEILAMEKMLDEQNPALAAGFQQQQLQQQQLAAQLSNNPLLSLDPYAATAATLGGGVGGLNPHSTAYYSPSYGAGLRYNSTGALDSLGFGGYGLGSGSKRSRYRRSGTSGLTSGLTGLSTSVGLGSTSSHRRSSSRSRSRSQYPRFEDPFLNKLQLLSKK